MTLIASRSKRVSLALYFYSGGVQGAEGLLSHVVFRQGMIREESRITQLRPGYSRTQPGVFPEHSVHAPGYSPHIPAPVPEQKAAPYQAESGNRNPNPAG